MGRTLLCGLGVGFSVLLLLVCAAKLSADGQGLGIATTGSPHNFADNMVGGVSAPDFEIGTGTPWNLREEICRVCHVPHDHNRATLYGQNGLLWNHTVSTATYTMYSSPSLDGAIAGQPSGIAKLCLGCHDGLMGVDTFDMYAGGAVKIGDYDGDFQVPGALWGGGTAAADLSATHPISIEYDETADPGLNSKASTMGTSGSIGDVLEGGTTLQCSSCHDVHDQAGEAVAGTHLLRVAQTVADGGSASGLCLTCHDK